MTAGLPVTARDEVARQAEAAVTAMLAQLASAAAGDALPIGAAAQPLAGEQA